MTLLAHYRSFGAIPVTSTVVKTCGIMRADHALLAASHGAHLIGLVFARSRRTVTLEIASSIRRALDGLDQRPLLVGVFVNELPEVVLAVAAQVGLDVVQLSGDEAPGAVAECADQFPVLKALRFPVGTPTEVALDSMKAYRALVPVKRLRFLIDSYHAGEYGGTGKLADWGIATELARHEEIMLAGGLTPRSVTDAIQHVAPWGVDVSSGIEHDGVKDPSLIVAFIANAKQSQRNRQNLV